MKKTKRMICLPLVCAVILSLLGTTVWAADASSYGVTLEPSASSAAPGGSFTVSVVLTGTANAAAPAAAQVKLAYSGAECTGAETEDGISNIRATYGTGACVVSYYDYNGGSFDADGKLTLATCTFTAAASGAESAVISVAEASAGKSGGTTGEAISVSDVQAEVAIQASTQPYSITVAESAKGTITFTVNGQSDVTTAVQGAEIDVSVEPPNGYELTKLTCTYGDTTVDITSSKSFTMPAADVTIEAAYTGKEYKLKASYGDGYTFTFMVNNKSATSARTGDTVKVIVTCPANKRLTSLHYVNLYPYGADQQHFDTDITSTKQFTMPDYDVVLTMVFEDIYSCTKYAGSSLYLIVYRPESALTEGTYTYDGNDMLYDAANNRWVCLVNSSVTGLSESSFTVNSSGTRVCVPTGSDLNGDGTVNIADAQIAYDIATNGIGLNDADMGMLLQADVDGDGKVSYLYDTEAILKEIHKAFYSAE